MKQCTNAYVLMQIFSKIKVKNNEKQRKQKVERKLLCLVQLNGEKRSEKARK